MSILVSYKTNNECFHSCNGKSFASLIGTLHLSPHENVLKSFNTIALMMTIHYFYTETISL